MRLALEVLGFGLLVAAASTVGSGLAMLVAGLGLIVFANSPERTKPPT